MGSEQRELRAPAPPREACEGRPWSRSGCATLQGCHWLRGPLIQREGAREPGPQDSAFPGPPPAARREERGRGTMSAHQARCRSSAVTSHSHHPPTFTTIQHGVCVSALLDSGTGAGDLIKRAHAAQETRRGLWRDGPSDRPLPGTRLPAQARGQASSVGQSTPLGGGEGAHTAVRPGEESQAFRREATCADG